MRRQKNAWLLVLFLIIGSFLGSIIGQAMGGVLPVLNVASRTYGLTPPFVLSLDMFTLTFGFTFKLSVAGVIGMLISLLLYRRI